MKAYGLQWKLTSLLNMQIHGILENHRVISKDCVWCWIQGRPGLNGLKGEKGDSGGGYGGYSLPVRKAYVIKCCMYCTVCTGWYYSSQCTTYLTCLHVHKLFCLLQGSFLFMSMYHSLLLSSNLISSMVAHYWRTRVSLGVKSTEQCLESIWFSCSYLPLLV